MIDNISNINKLHLHLSIYFSSVPDNCINLLSRENFMQVRDTYIKQNKLIRDKELRASTVF